MNDIRSVVSITKNEGDYKLPTHHVDLKILLFFVKKGQTPKTRGQRVRDQHLIIEVRGTTGLLSLAFLNLALLILTTPAASPNLEKG